MQRSFSFPSKLAAVPRVRAGKRGSAKRARGEGHQYGRNALKIGTSTRATWGVGHMTNQPERGTKLISCQSLSVQVSVREGALGERAL